MSKSLIVIVKVVDDDLGIVDEEFFRRINSAYGDNIEREFRAMGELYGKKIDPDHYKEYNYE